VPCFDGLIWIAHDWAEFDRVDRQLFELVAQDLVNVDPYVDVRAPRNLGKQRESTQGAHALLGVTEATADQTADVRRQRVMRRPCPPRWLERLDDLDRPDTRPVFFGGPSRGGIRRDGCEHGALMLRRQTRDGAAQCQTYARIDESIPLA
jgi:hypothetical protein